MLTSKSSLAPSNSTVIDNPAIQPPERTSSNYSRLLIGAAAIVIVFLIIGGYFISTDQNDNIPAKTAINIEKVNDNTATAFQSESTISKEKKATEKTIKKSKQERATETYQKYLDSKTTYKRD